ncbi:MAG TPA: hypothetical protein PLG79_11120 [Spirochaetales bacterium]|nr:hypothetical protein [Spirochaetales bacterium]HOV39266.1 hypothetical protein [Spirochaetales bacterium]
MKALVHFKDPLLLGGFISNLFNGFLNPLYISAIMGCIEPRIVSLGSFMSSAFPVLLGFLLENPKLFETLYQALPILMVVEIVLSALILYASEGNAVIIYLSGMFMFGVFSTSILYLLQRVKEIRFQEERAAWDRRSASVDALGYLLGSFAVFFCNLEAWNPKYIAAGGLVQTTCVYALFFISYLTVRKRKRFLEEEVPPPWGEISQLRPCYNVT